MLQWAGPFFFSFFGLEDPSQSLDKADGENPITTEDLSFFRSLPFFWFRMGSSVQFFIPKGMWNVFSRHQCLNLLEVPRHPPTTLPPPH